MITDNALALLEEYSAKTVEFLDRVELEIQATGKTFPVKYTETGVPLAEYAEAIHAIEQRAEGESLRLVEKARQIAELMNLNDSAEFRAVLRNAKIGMYAQHYAPLILAETLAELAGF